MEIIRLADGRRAATNVDCIHIEQAADGRFQLTGSALSMPKDGEDVDESTAIVGGAFYPGEEEAEAAGIAWAEEQGVATLYISHGSIDD